MSNSSTPEFPSLSPAEQTLVNELFCILVYRCQKSSVEEGPPVVQTYLEIAKNLKFDPNYQDSLAMRMALLQRNQPLARWLFNLGSQVNPSVITAGAPKNTEVSQYFKNLNTTSPYFLDFHLFQLRHPDSQHCIVPAAADLIHFILECEPTLENYLVAARGIFATYSADPIDVTQKVLETLGVTQFLESYILSRGVGLKTLPAKTIPRF